jgi:hypothetical protein
MADSSFVGRVGGPFMPEYRHEPVVFVELRFPFAIAGQVIDRIGLSPPTFDDLARLRRAETQSAAELIAAMSGWPPPVIGMVRWPDVEAILREALELLPPDMVAIGAAEAAAPAAEPPMAPAEPLGEASDLFAEAAAEELRRAAE